MKTPDKVVKKEIHVKVDKDVRTVEKYFKKLTFGNQLRLATDVLVKRAIEEEKDLVLITNCAEAPQAEFTITVKLTNVKKP